MVDIYVRFLLMPSRWFPFALAYWEYGRKRYLYLYIIIGDKTGYHLNLPDKKRHALHP